MTNTAIIFLLLIPLILIELGFRIFCIVDIVKKKSMDSNQRLMWLLLVIFVSIIGWVLYLVIGRKEDEANNE